MAPEHDIVAVVGAGQAGAELALALRQQSCRSAIVLIGQETHPPYQRPLLSKAYLKGDCDTSSLHSRQPSTYARADIRLMLNTRVVGVDRERKLLSIADGLELPYARLALTTGGRVRKLAIPGADSAEHAGLLHYLRTLEDVRRIRERLRRGTRLVIIGGGYLGLEVAAAAVALGADVTVLEAAQRVLARVTAAEVSAFYETVHREAGVDVRTGIEVTALRCDAELLEVQCGHEVLTADLAIAGIGIVPNVELAQAAGLEVDGGIVVDEQSRTSDPDIVAAGDCAARSDTFDGRRIRLESVPAAIEQARIAAATLANRPHAAPGVPWFWSDQYDLKLQTCGLSRGYHETAVRGSMRARSFMVFYLKGGRVIAGDAVNRPQDFQFARKLVATRATVGPALLADEAVSLRALAAAAETADLASARNMHPLRNPAVST